MIHNWKLEYRLREVFMQGQDARRDGKRANDCPFDAPREPPEISIEHASLNDQLYNEWMRGWMVG